MDNINLKLFDEIEKINNKQNDILKKAKNEKNKMIKMDNEINKQLTILIIEYFKKMNQYKEQMENKSDLENKKYVCMKLMELIKNPYQEKQIIENN